MGNGLFLRRLTLGLPRAIVMGIIGLPNGSGKSTFLKILSGEIDPSTGTVSFTPGERMAVLNQNHYQFDEFSVIETVLIGHKEMYQVMKEKDAIYAKEDFTEADGHRAGDLENLFAEMDGWNAESNAATLLSNLVAKEDLHYKLLKELDFGNYGKYACCWHRHFLVTRISYCLMSQPTTSTSTPSVGWRISWQATRPLFWWYRTTGTSSIRCVRMWWIFILAR